MSSLKSHFRHNLQHQAQDPLSQSYKHTSRIPTKPIGADGGQSSRTAQNVSKLTKRANKSATNPPEPNVKSRTARSAAPLTAATQETVGTNKRSSVTRLGHTQSFAPPTIRTPSLVSGSSVSTFESPRSMTLRRKPSGAIDRYVLQKQSTTTVGMEQNPTIVRNRGVSSPDIYDSTVLGISLPPTADYNEAPPVPDMEAGVSGADVFRDFTPPVQGAYALSTTPSTRYTDSPFSHIPTPSSVSSFSSSIFVTSGLIYQSRSTDDPVGSRFPLSGRPFSKDEDPKPGLPPVRESSTSSSNSTIRPRLRPSFAAPNPRAKVTEAPASQSSERAGERAVKPSKRRDKSGTSRAQQPGQVCPELAHLVDDISLGTVSTGKTPPPARPTRNGMPNLSDMSSPSSVVQSNLPRLYTTYHKRVPSRETPVSASSPSLKSRFGFSSRSSSRTESGRIDSAISPPSAARDFNRSSTPESLRKEGARLRREDSPALTSGASPAKTSRFGFFSRKPKGEPQRVLEKPRRRPSKGPAAGTGHEVYARFSSRGRGSSASSNTGLVSPSPESASSIMAPAQRSSSNRKSRSTSKDDSDLDDFLRERLIPVVLRGSGSTLSATASNSDIPETSLRPSSSSKSSSLDSIPHPHLLPSALQNPASASPTKRPNRRHSRGPSDGSKDNSAACYPSLATRRSLTRTSSSSSRSPVRIPASINTNIVVRSATLDSLDSETSTWPRTDSTIPLQDGLFSGEEPSRDLRPRSPTSVSPSKAGIRRNFLDHINSSPRPRSKGKERALDVPHAQEIHHPQFPYRSLTHYAIGSVEPVALQEVRHIAQETDTSSEDQTLESDAPVRLMPYEPRHSSLLPSPPETAYHGSAELHARGAPPRIMVHRQPPAGTSEPLHAQCALANQTTQSPPVSHPLTDYQAAPLQVPGFVTPDSAASEGREESYNTTERSHESPRQPRLSPVGRIPAVVSKRDRDRKLPDISFSRPFVRTQPRPSVKPPGAIYSQIRDMASPIESNSHPISSSSTRSESKSISHKSNSVTITPSAYANRTSMEVSASHSEFFAFPPRKDSEQSYSSCSNPPSWVVAAYSQPPQQDDIWNEYNDLIDEVMTLKTPTTGSSLGAPFQFSSMLYDNEYGPFPIPAAPGLPPSHDLPLPPIADNASAVLTVPQQIARFLQPSMSPLTPDSIFNFESGYDNCSMSTLFTDTRESMSGQQNNSIQLRDRSSVPSARGSTISPSSSLGSSHSRSLSMPGSGQCQSQSNMTLSTRYTRDTQLLDIAEAPLASATGTSSNLRVGALMTSKWLSFGRVLFSPAHHELHFADQGKILVIDGLSSDWSYYVALSYPSAQVYNLTPATSASSSFDWPESTNEPPPNHHQVPWANIATPFPYPKGFFTAVLFRFPTATTEQGYTACISECKRVLRPGGYLEVAVLDLDLMNMGVKARKAVRGLKTRMQAQDQKVCLRNLSDILLRLIGRRGFDPPQRCIVGVPAAGRIPRSQDLSSASSDSGKPIWHREARTSKSQEFSFADLLEDVKCNQFGDGKNNDEAITKMVAKVGRWWYSSCYEKTLLPRDQSIWSDPKLLRECERQGTSFRLLICYAQKPMQPPRRTVSV